MLSDPDESATLERPLAAADPLCGRVLANRYRLEKRIGQGGFGSVYAARDSRLDRRVALKLIHASGLSPEARARFGREGRATARLQHPNAVTIHDAGEDPLGLFLVLEMVDGVSLRERLGSGPLPPREAVRIAREVHAALRAGHALGIVHRDVKPANVLLDAGGTAKVADFGIARLVGHSALTAEGSFVGTPSYMSPEQLEGREAGPAADLFSLGCVLHEMLAGRPPFPGASLTEVVSRILAGRAESLPESIDDAELRGVVSGLLCREPGARLAAADKLAAGLPGATGATASGRRTRWPPRARWMAGVVLVALGSAAAAVASRAARPELGALGHVKVDFEEFRNRYWQQQLGPAMKRVSFAEDEATPDRVVRELAALTGINFGVYPGPGAGVLMNRSIVLHLQDVPWPIALQAALGTDLAFAYDDNLVMVGRGSDIVDANGVDMLVFVEEHVSTSAPRLGIPALAALASPAGRRFPVPIDADRTAWVVLDQPLHAWFIAEKLRAMGVFSRVEQVTVDSLACPAPELAMPAAAEAILVRARPGGGRLDRRSLTRSYAAVPLTAVLADLAGEAGLSISSQGLGGQVTLTFQELPARRFLDVVLRASGLRSNCREGVRVLFPAHGAAAFRKTVLFEVAHAQAGDLLSSLESLLTPHGEVQAQGDGALRVTDVDDGLFRVEVFLAARRAVVEAALARDSPWSRLRRRFWAGSRS